MKIQSPEQKLKIAYPTIKKLAMKRLPDMHEDLTQEVALRLWKVRDALPRELRRSYLQAVVSHTACDLIRSESRSRRIIQMHQQGVIDLCTEAQMAVCEPIASNYTIQRLDDAFTQLNKLSPREQAIFKLLMEEKTYEQIASILKMSLGTVRSRIHYTRKKISKHFA